MVIPDVDLRNLTVGRGKWFSPVPRSVLVLEITRLHTLIYRIDHIPSDVVLQVVVITSLTKLLREGIFPSLLWVVDSSPSSQRTTDSDSIVVDLITATDPIAKVRLAEHKRRPSMTYMTWKGATAWRRRTSFHRAGPLQASSSVPTLNPLHEWNMILKDSVAAGTLNRFFCGFVLLAKRKSGRVYSHVVSVWPISAVTSNLQKVFLGSEYKQTPLISVP
jgi:hypothetical protein